MQMKVRDEIARRYWRLAAIEEVRARFEAEGFRVNTEVAVGRFNADLVAKHGTRQVVVEFKLAGGRPDRDDEAVGLRNEVVHKLGAEFQLVWVAPPREREIEIEGLEGVLCEWLTENVPSALESLSTHTYIDDVSDLFLSEVTVRRNHIEVEGDATVLVDLNYGSSSDSERGDGATHADGYPFHFDIVLNMNLDITEVKELHVDTSSFYE
jgi:hypothetical protein